MQERNISELVRGVGMGGKHEYFTKTGINSYGAFNAAFNIKIPVTR
jgi:hypothetical protein